MYDPDWYATIDGRPTPVIETNTALRGIRVPSGSHLIRMEYHSVAVRRGLIAALVAAIVISLWALILAVERR